MSARDIFHNAVKAALQKDGWIITHDPLTIDLADGQLPQLSLQKYQVKVVAFYPENEVIVKWTS
ncbi:MAG: element excision factor XisH family protein [Phormidesmis sp.]